MDKALLRKHIKSYLTKLAANRTTPFADLDDRRGREDYYQSWTAERLRRINADELAQYISKLWAMQIWGNKQYVIDKLIVDNTIQKLGAQLADLIWSAQPVELRWDNFRKNVKGMGPAMISELLCYVHSATCMLWNRRAFVGLNYLGVENLPRYDYQLTGKRYRELCGIVSEIAGEMRALGDEKANLLTVDYFIWDELQVADTLTDVYKASVAPTPIVPVDRVDNTTSAFIHDEVRDKIAEIGRWLGLQADTERKVADGAVVDAIWQVTIGNMGRVIYVFEVQTKGSIDSLILNLLKSLNNPAVQGVVAVSDAAQLEKIKAEAATVQGLKDKLKFWDYVQVLEVHESLASVNEAINRLGLVPQGF